MAEATQAEQEAINVLFEQVENTFTARDLDGFVDCFDDNVVCLPARPAPGHWQRSIAQVAICVVG